MEPQMCVVCHQPLPRNSKLTLVSVRREEAEQNAWAGHQEPDGTAIVDMCLQCQIDRSKSRKQGSALAG
jgi:hypothetical protein